MKIVVLLKQTPDTETQVQLSDDKKTIDHSATKFIVNPYDEYAIEEALKIKEGNSPCEVVVATFGPAASKERVVRALAMGADRGIVIENTEYESLDALGISHVLAALLTKEGPDMVFCGKQAIDDDNMHVPTMTAELMGWPSINVVTSMSKQDDGWQVEREIEGGQKEVYAVKGPFIVGAHKSLNQPRYVAVPGIMRAKRKPFDLLKPSDLGLDRAELEAVSKTRIESYTYPPAKPKGQIFQGESVEVMVDKVVKLLREEAKVI